MTSYERLADAAFAAAMDVQLRIEGKATNLENFNEFVNLLKEPVHSENSYKLLQDPRNVPIYKAAWSNVYGGVTKDLKTEAVLSNIANLLKRFEENFQKQKPADVKKMVDFCLSLNSSFLDENGRSLNGAFNNRVQYASS